MVVKAVARKWKAPARGAPLLAHALVQRAPEQPAAKPSGTRAQKLLVGSFNVKPRLQTKPQQPQGVGNQAAPHFGDAHGFFNHMSGP